VPAQLSDKARALINRPVLATLATIDGKGRPHLTPLWIDLDGDDLIINTAQGRAKARHLEANPEVGVTVIDPDDAYNVVAVRGTVTDVTTEGADAVIDGLAKKYLGVDSYPMRRADEVRITVRIRPDRILMQSA
jgi:PPOX class probable F420-dependent enzyme